MYLETMGIRLGCRNWMIFARDVLDSISVKHQTSEDMSGALDIVETFLSRLVDTIHLSWPAIYDSAQHLLPDILRAELPSYLIGLGFGVNDAHVIAAEQNWSDLAPSRWSRRWRRAQPTN